MAESVMANFIHLQEMARSEEVRKPEQVKEGRRKKRLDDAGSWKRRGPRGISRSGRRTQGPGGQTTGENYRPGRGSL